MQAIKPLSEEELQQELKLNIELENYAPALASLEKLLLLDGGNLQYHFQRGAIL